jgi:CHASE2 domain-containing sensor protein
LNGKGKLKILITDIDLLDKEVPGTSVEFHKDRLRCDILGRRRVRRAYAKYMKIAGFLLLLAGWALILSALALLARSGPRSAFLLAGSGVELLGLVLFARSHLTLKKEDRD